MVKKKPLAITAARATQLIQKREDQVCGPFVSDVLSTISYRIERNIRNTGEATTTFEPRDDEKLRMVLNNPNARNNLFVAILDAGYDIKFTYNDPEGKVDFRTAVKELNETDCDPAVVATVYAKYITHINICLPKGARDVAQEEPGAAEKSAKKGKKD